jgi:hypothetical protein
MIKITGKLEGLCFKEKILELKKEILKALFGFASVSLPVMNQLTSFFVKCSV